VEQLEQRLAMTATLSLVSRAWSVLEGDRAEFTLTLSEPSKFPERVMVTTAPGTATYGSDYFAPPSTQVLFSPGQTRRSFSISILTDNKTEGPETFQVIATPANKLLGTRAVAVAITDLPKEQPGFQITMDYDASVKPGIKSLFDAAAARWSKVITGDLPAVKYIANGQTRVIDDLLIFADVQALPDPDTIAQATFHDIRVGNSGTPANTNFSQKGLPYVGSMTINTLYVNSVGIENTIAHEMGHVLGFGSLWRRVGPYASTVSGIGTADPRFLGPNAVREYNSLFGRRETGVPLYEQSQITPISYDGSYGVHLRDSVFSYAGAAVQVSNRYFELMTARYDPDTALPNGRSIASYLSKVTVGVMADLGYRVNYAAADNYSKPPVSPQALVAAVPSAPTGFSAPIKSVAVKAPSVAALMPVLQGKSSSVSLQPSAIDSASSRRSVALVPNSRVARPATRPAGLTPLTLSGLHRG
jgi:hypothetical protein